MRAKWYSKANSTSDWAIGQAEMPPWATPRESLLPMFAIGLGLTACHAGFNFIEAASLATHILGAWVWWACTARYVRSRAQPERVRV